MYTDRWKWPLGAVLGHSCTLLRRELRRVAQAAQPPWCAGAPSVAASPLVGNRFCATGSARVVLPAARLAFPLRRQPTQASEKAS